MKRARSGSAINCDSTNSNSINMAHILMLLSQNSTENTIHPVQYYPAITDQERVFECKTCKRKFPSFQALGGHRASHKKPRITSPEEHCTDHAAAAKPKLHECTICGLEFNVGQALGGHMRRHRQIGHSETEGFSGSGNGGLGGLFHVEMKMPILTTDQGETGKAACMKDREPVTLNLFV